ncbi:MAG TPA: TonB-dependent receptor, partial [Vicingus sp.]|nr:TonB-dependent receptor [Vicingus sp.]
MIFNRILKTTILLLVSFGSFFSQQVGQIKGVVKDVESEKPIEFSTVSVFNVSDSTLQTGVVTDVNGLFLIDQVPFGNYYVKIEFIGFAPFVINDIAVSEQMQVIDLAEIKLAAFSKNMDQFEFVDEKELMETKIDKKVYNVSKDISVQGGTGLDVVKNMPSVEVDEQEKISLRGDKGVQILIDGRPSTVSPSQLLKQIPASSIEKIEVITNPSAKYNPEGMSGILNVITKKEKASGFNGSVNGGYQYNQNHGYNGSLNLT